MNTAAPPRTRPFIVGVDGGGSKTHALAADAGGHIVGRGAAGPSNYHAVGLEAATAALETAITAALTAAGSAPATPPLAALCLGLAGMGRPADRVLIAAWAAQRFPSTPTLIVTDAELVVAAGTPAGWGLALICGTGSLAFGVDPAGHTARAGGWGYLLGDEGSGYALGLAALRAIARAADGRGPQTALTAAVLQHWKLTQPQDLIHYVYQGHIERADIAALATLVEAAAEHDAVAQAISATAGHELALALNAVAQQLALRGALPCALAGSVLIHGCHIRAALLQAATGLGLTLDPIALVADPALGALKLAQRLTEPTTPDT